MPDQAHGVRNTGDGRQSFVGVGSGRVRIGIARYGLLDQKGAYALRHAERGGRRGAVMIVQRDLTLLGNTEGIR